MTCVKIIKRKMTKKNRKDINVGIFDLLNKKGSLRKIIQLQRKIR